MKLFGQTLIALIAGFTAIWIFMPGHGSQNGTSATRTPQKHIASINPYSLEQQRTYRVSKSTPLMPEVQPRDPLKALGRAQQISAGNLIQIISTSNVRGHPWYEVVAKDNQGNRLGSGWVNGIALLGQNLELVSR